MQFVTSLAFAKPEELGALARASEEAGFAAAALSDHLIPPRELKTPYPYTPDGIPRWEPFTDWPDPWVTTAHLAAQTERIRIGALVTSITIRHPALFAKEALTIDHISGGLL